MRLKYHEEISTINNCPLENEDGEKVLFRITENPISDDSFTPQAVLLKPKYRTLCKAWGLSMFTELDAAKRILSNLSKSKQVNYKVVAFSALNDQDGVKYSGKNKKHYTFFPYENVDLVEKFEIVA